MSKANEEYSLQLGCVCNLEIEITLLYEQKRELNQFRNEAGSLRIGFVIHTRISLLDQNIGLCIRYAQYLLHQKMWVVDLPKPRDVYIRYAHPWNNNDSLIKIQPYSCKQLAVYSLRSFLMGTVLLAAIGCDTSLQIQQSAAISLSH